jgi:hypothetical protein
MDNGQWTMDNGQWTMDNGQWTIKINAIRVFSLSIVQLVSKSRD